MPSHVKSDVEVAVEDVAPEINKSKSRLISKKFSKITTKVFLAFAILTSTLTIGGVVAFLKWRADYQPIALTAGGYGPTLTLSSGKAVPADTKSILGVQSWQVPRGKTFLEMSFNLANQNVWPVTIVSFGVPVTSREIFIKHEVRVGWSPTFEGNAPLRNFQLARSTGGTAYIKLQVECTTKLQGQTFDFQSIPVTTSFLGQIHHLMINSLFMVSLKFPAHC